MAGSRYNLRGQSKRMRLFNDGNVWEMIKDGDLRGLDIFKRHYSYRKDRTHQKLFVGPGEKMILITLDETALFVWRKFISDNGQTGINCAVFRNEGTLKSSDLILEAEKIAWKRWPGERFYTYVNPRAVISQNAGYCFKCAGWKKVGVTQKRNYLILEKLWDSASTVALSQ